LDEKYHLESFQVIKLTFSFLKGFQSLWDDASVKDLHKVIQMVIDETSSISEVTEFADDMDRDTSSIEFSDDFDCPRDLRRTVSLSQVMKRLSMQKNADSDLYSFFQMRSFGEGNGKLEVDPQQMHNSFFDDSCFAVLDEFNEDISSFIRLVPLREAPNPPSLRSSRSSRRSLGASDRLGDRGSLPHPLP
jgi:hypothetical protein